MDELAILMGQVTHGARCDLPLEWRLQVLEEAISQVVPGISVQAVEYTVLPPDELKPVMDALVDPASDFPLVFVDDRVVCSGGIDVPSVSAALASTVNR